MFSTDITKQTSGVARSTAPERRRRSKQAMSKHWLSIMIRLDKLEQDLHVNPVLNHVSIMVTLTKDKTVGFTPSSRRQTGIRQNTFGRLNHMLIMARTDIINHGRMARTRHWTT